MKKLTLIGIISTFLLGLALWQQQDISVANAAPMLAPIVIDDFNTGALSLSGPSAVSNDQLASGAIGGSRDVVLGDSGGPTPTVMSLTPGNGYLNVALGDSPGNYNIGWGNSFIIGGTDLNLNASSYDRIVVTLSQAPSSGQVTVVFNRSGDTDSADASSPLNGAGNYTFLFSHPSLSPLNPSDIDGIAIFFDSGVTAGLNIINILHGSMIILGAYAAYLRVHVRHRSVPLRRLAGGVAVRARLRVAGRLINRVIERRC